MLPSAVEAMLPFLGGSHGNPSSPHAKGRAARRAIDDARDELAEFLGCAAGDLVFTSGGTEADNLAIAGTGGDGGEGAVVVSAVEHHAVLEPALRRGRVCAVDHNASFDLEHLAELDRRRREPDLDDGREQRSRDDRAARRGGGTRSCARRPGHFCTVTPCRRRRGSTSRS